MKLSHRTRSILVALLRGGLILLALSGQNPGKLNLLKAFDSELKRRSDRQKFLWTLAYLRRKKYISCEERDNGEVKIVLTENGRKQALRYNLDTISLTKNEKWDRKWRVVAFDIPEHKKRGRDSLGIKMRELGMIPLQKSVWVWPYECRNEIDFIAEIFGVGKYIHHLLVESITSEKYLLYKFGLN